MILDVPKSAFYCILIACLTPFSPIRASPVYSEVEKTIIWMKKVDWNKKQKSPASYQLDSILKTFVEKSDKRVAWYCKIFKYKASGPLGNDLKAQVIQLNSIDSLLQECPESEVKAYFWFRHALFNFENQLFRKGLQLLFNARDELERTGYENVVDAGDYLYGFGLCYYQFGDMHTAIQYLEQAIKFPPADKTLIIAVRNTLGMANQKAGSYERAKIYFNEAINLAEIHRDSVYMGIATGNYGNNLLLEGMAAASLPFLYKDYQINVTREPANTAITCIYLAKALMQLDSLSKAKMFLDKSVLLSKSIRNPFLTNYPIGYFEARAMYFRKIRNYEMASAYVDSVIHLKDSLNSIFNSQILMVNNLAIETDRYQTRRINIERDNDSAVFIRYIIIGFILVFGAGVVYVVIQKQHQLAAEQVLQKEQTAYAEEQLRMANEELQRYILSIQEKNKFIDNIGKELDTAQKDPESVEIKRDFSEYKTSLSKSVILTERDWIQFRRLFEKVYPNFLDLLRIKYKNLTPAEIRLFALLKLEISVKDMAYMLGVSSDAVRKLKRRLGKKMEYHHPETSLEDLVKELS